MWSVRIRRPASTSFSIVRHKLRLVASVFVTTMRRWRRERNIKPKDSAVGMAKAMGVELLTEEEYFELQKLEEFDTKRSTWIKTPAEMRKLGGALYCDRRYGRVFVGHNGAESYYNGRAFRGSLRI